MTTTDDGDDKALELMKQFRSTASNDDIVCISRDDGVDDEHWLSDDVLIPKDKYTNGFTLNSYYVEVDENTSLAVDVYLPKSNGNKKFPTALHFTRYYRNWEFSKCSACCCTLTTCCCCFGACTSILKMGGGLPGMATDAHWNMRSIMYTEVFLPAGYAWVSVDVRGTGASDGHRRIDLSPEEVSDIPKMSKWVTQQPWCNGDIISMGISYDGMSAVLLGAASLATTKAIAPLFAPIDLYDELSHPGGIRCIGFTAEYSKFTYNLERNTPTKCDYPPMIKKLIRLLMNGVRKVGADSQRLEEAVSQHEDNWDMMDVQRAVLNRNDDVPDLDVHVDDISVHSYIPKLLNACMENNLRCFFVSGYYDSGSALGAVRMFMTLENSNNCRLLLGPWNHGARNNSSPFAANNKPSFNLVAELLRFFSSENGDDDDDDGERPVIYYTIGEEKWKSARTWPPPNTTSKSWSLQSGNLLVNRSVDDIEYEEKEFINNDKTYSFSEYNINMDATTGKLSRWNLVQHLFKRPVLYPSRKSQDSKNIVFDSFPLTESMEITGHPIVTLIVNINATDAPLFVYLEEILKNGRVVYLTEGQLRLTARSCEMKQQQEEQRPYKQPIPFRTYLKEDNLPIKPGMNLKATIPLFPISYRYKKHSKIRISIACADKDNFDPLESTAIASIAAPTVLRVLHSFSYVTLPVVVNNV